MSPSDCALFFLRLKVLSTEHNYIVAHIALLQPHKISMHTLVSKEHEI